MAMLLEEEAPDQPALTLSGDQMFLSSSPEEC